MIAMQNFPENLSEDVRARAAKLKVLPEDVEEKFAHKAKNRAATNIPRRENTNHSVMKSPLNSCTVKKKNSTGVA